MNAIDTTYRAEIPEAMDDFEMKGTEVSDALDKIASINRFLGGNQLTLNGVEKLLRDCPKEQAISIIDIGCGNGDMLRQLAKVARQKGRSYKLTGVDANQFTVGHATKLSSGFPEIDFHRMNVFSDAFENMRYDIALITLTLHHFTDEEIIKLVGMMKRNARIGIVVNDLHRSSIAYRLFLLVCSFFRLSRLSKEDGLISIRRGFKKRDLENYSKKLNLKKYSIHWKWAFRYQWIISTI